MAEGGGFTMRLREKFGSSLKKDPVVPTVDSVEEAVSLTRNGAPHVKVNGSPEPHEPSAGDTQKPRAIEPGQINDETVLTDTGDLPIEKLTGFLEGKIPNPNIAPPKDNGTQNGK